MNIIELFRGRFESATSKYQVKLNFWRGIRTQVLHRNYLVQYTKYRNEVARANFSHWCRIPLKSLVEYTLGRMPDLRRILLVSAGSFNGLSSTFSYVLSNAA